MQVLPAAQTVPPVHPEPPHCPYFATVVPVGVATAEVDVVVTLLVALVVFDEVADVVTAVVPCVVGEADVVGDEPPTEPPVQTAGPGGVYVVGWYGLEIAPTSVMVEVNLLLDSRCLLEYQDLSGCMRRGTRQEAQELRFLPQSL